MFRCLSSLQEERLRASSILNGPDKKNPALGGKFEFVEKIRKALYASKIVSYAQGFMLLREAAQNFGWKLNYGGIALMWRGGCIIRSAFLGKIKLVNTYLLLNMNMNYSSRIHEIPFGFQFYEII